VGKSEIFRQTLSFGGFPSTENHKKCENFFFLSNKRCWEGHERHCMLQMPCRQGAASTYQQMIALTAACAPAGRGTTWPNKGILLRLNGISTTYSAPPLGPYHPTLAKPSENECQRLLQHWKAPGAIRRAAGWLLSSSRYVRFFWRDHTRISGETGHSL